jgi:hypothetical protein
MFRSTVGTGAHKWSDKGVGRNRNLTVMSGCARVFELKCVDELLLPTLKMRSDFINAPNRATIDVDGLINNDHCRRFLDLTAWSMLRTNIPIWIAPLSVCSLNRRMDYCWVSLFFK